MKVLLKRFHLNGHTIGFHPQTQKNHLNVSVTDSESERVNSQGWGWGDAPLYMLCRYELPQEVWFLSHFGLKIGMGFNHLVEMKV